MSNPSEIKKNFKYEIYDPALFSQVRMKGIGGSDIAKIVGVARFGTPLELFLNKKGLKETPVNAAMRRGSRMEGVVAEEYAETTGQDLFIPKSSFDNSSGYVGVVRDPDVDHFFFHPDGFVLDNIDKTKITKGLEIKTSKVWEIWGPSYSDDVHEEYIIQCQWGMSLTGLEVFDLAALIAGSDFRVYPIKRNEELITMLRQAADSFWHNHVLADVPPDPSGTNTDKQVLAAIYKGGGGVLAPSADMIEAVYSYETAKEKYKEAEAELLEHENKIKGIMKDHETCVSDAVKVSWKTIHNRGKLNYKRIAEALAAQKNAKMILEKMESDDSYRDPYDYRRFSAKGLK